LVISAISTLLGGFQTTPKPPGFVFETARPPYTHERFTPHHHIPYYLNPNEVNTLTKAKFAQLDRNAEVTFVQRLRDQCELEHDSRQRKIIAQENWLGRPKDKKAWDEAFAIQLPSCERLTKMGYRREMY
jgi:DnaJ homolog subfamily B member 12